MTSEDENDGDYNNKSSLAVRHGSDYFILKRPLYTSALVIVVSCIGHIKQTLMRNTVLLPTRGIRSRGYSF